MTIPRGTEGDRPTAAADPVASAAEALGATVVVTGAGPVGTAAAGRVADADPAGATVVTATDGDREGDGAAVLDGGDGRADGDEHGGVLADAEALLVAVDHAAPTAPALDLVAAAHDAEASAYVVVRTPAGRAAPTSWDAVDRLTGAADAVVLAPAADGDTDDEAAAAALGRSLSGLVAIVGRPGVVNLDVADLRTVLGAGPVAVFAAGTARDGRPGTAVRAALGPVDATVGFHGESPVLVAVRGGPGMSVAAASGVTAAVHDRLAADAHVIWGANVREELGESVTARLVVGDVTPVPAPGDACPRCGGRFAPPALRGHAAATCRGCGYAGLGTALRR